MSERTSRATPRLPQPSEPALLTLFRFGQDPLGSPGRYFAEHGDTFQSQILGERLIMTRDPVWIQNVLVAQAGSFIKDKTTKGLSLLLGQGLLTSDGEVWRSRRKTFGPYFQPPEIERSLSIFAEEVEAELRRFPRQGVVDVQEALTRLTMRVVLRALFGADPNHATGFEEIMSASMVYFEGVAGTQTPLPTWIPTPVNRRFLAARKELRSRLATIVQSARQAGPSDTLLTRLHQARESRALSAEQFIDECITLLVAGHETTALALCYALHLLAMHPLAQRRLHDELLSTGLPETVQECQRAGVLRNTLTETLRLYPVAWALGREAREEVTIEGHVIERGTQVYVHQWQAHRHPVHFHEPEQFLPDRWTDAFLATLPKNLYAPFGAGPRICIGNHFALAEMSVVLSRLVSAYEFTRHSTAEVRLRASITVRPRERLLLRVRRRSSR